MRNLFRALRHPNYRVYIAGQTVSHVGSWMQSVALGWLVYRLTGSASMLGVVALAQQGTGFLVGPFAGVIVDRYDKRRIIVATQTVVMVAAGVLSALTFSGAVRPAHVVVLAFVSGIAWAIDIPARQTLFITMVGRDDLPNAIALNSAIVNGARVIGPAVAGVVIAAVGEAWCFAFNTISFAPIIIAFMLMRFPREEHAAVRSSIVEEVREGVSFARSHAAVASLLVLHVLCAFFGNPYVVLLPAHVARILGGGPQTLGLLMACVGCGAFCGALIVASRPAGFDLRSWPLYGGVAFGSALVGFSFMRAIPAAAAFIFAAGFGCLIQSSSTNTLLQSFTPDRLRGRVMALYASLFMGAVPLGGFLAGVIADRFGEPAFIAGGGIVIAAASLWNIRALALPPEGEEFLSTGQEAGQ